MYWFDMAFMVGTPIVLAIYLVRFKDDSDKICSTCSRYRDGKCILNPIWIDVHPEHKCAQHTTKGDAHD